MTIPGLQTLPIGPWIHLVGMTFTGVDEFTELEVLEAMATATPGLEFGFLWSPTRAGKDNRYPSWAFLSSAAARLHDSGVRTALHLCGKGAGDWISGDAPTQNLALLFNRIQLNIRADRVDAGALHRQVASQAHPAVITQHHVLNAPVTELLAGCANHMVLFDESGGRGVERTVWPQALSHLPCGYAGGLGPGRMVDALEAIEKKCPQPYWVDMEGAIRDTQDRFDLTKVLAVVDEVLLPSPHVRRAAIP